MNLLFKTAAITCISITSIIFCCSSFVSSYTANALNNGDTVTDIDGNSYHTAQIGNQTWMVENLRVTKYRNGDAIQQVEDKDVWADLTTGGCCIYRNQPSLDTPYGKLYNWYAVNDKRSICPKGWHIPTDADWKKLEDFLGGEHAAGAIKALHTWDPPNGGATNMGGFAALSGGLRGYYGAYNAIGTFGYYWSSTGTDRGTAWFRKLTCYDAKISRDDALRETGFSCRCIKD